ncbi:MAG: DUF6765 family protein [Rickettsiales bacterium]
MDFEFHYYINYLLAKLGGFSQEDAYKIAYSSQYVDDNTTKYDVLCKRSGKVFSNQITQSFDLSMPLADLSRIYATWHFIPGGEHDARLDGKVSSTATTPNNPLAHLQLDKALMSGNSYAIGIASHAFADTWAHQNFTADYDDFNSGHSLVAKLLPNIGHADFLSYPDIIGVVWSDTRLVKPRICNNRRFIDCAVALLKKYAAHQGILPPTNYLRKLLEEIFGESEPYFLTSHYLKRMQRMRCYYEVMPELPPYDPSLWFYNTVRVELSGYSWVDGYLQSDWYGFCGGVASA